MACIKLEIFSNPVLFPPLQKEWRLESTGPFNAFGESKQRVGSTIVDGLVYRLLVDGWLIYQLIAIGLVGLVGLVGPVVSSISWLFNVCAPR